MLTEFNFHAPSFVVAGRNSVHQTGELLNQWGAGKNIMVVCGNKTYSLGLLNSLLDSIRSGGFTPCVFHGSLPDAPVETVRSGITYAKEHDVSAIVAFGGGSAMDTAKAIACMLDVDGDIIAYCKGQIKPIRRSNLLFAIPTTCGTGSESTDIGVVLDREANYKYIFANPFAGPDVAILDPVLLTALSPSMIAATAMDAFSHSAEAYTCKAANVMMEPLALASMEMIVKHLPAAMKEPGNLEELEQLLIASCMAGQAFTQVGLHLGHAIAHGVGVYGHVHHGTACALVLPYALSARSFLTALQGSVKFLAPKSRPKPPQRRSVALSAILCNRSTARSALGVFPTMASQRNSWTPWRNMQYMRAEHKGILSAHRPKQR